MSQHTPGPWTVVDGAVLSEQINTYGNWIVVGVERERTAEDEANLRLIAAAPETTNTMEWLADLLETFYGGRMNDMSPEERAAITKARALLKEIGNEPAHLGPRTKGLNVKDHKL